MNTNKLYFWQSFSLKTRLTFFYSLATAVLITVTALFLYFTTLHILHKATQQFLSDEINVIRNLLENQPNNILALQQEVVEIPNNTESSSEYRYYIRIIDQNHHTILQTPNFSNTLQAAYFFNQPPINNEKVSIRWDTSTNQFVLMQAYSKLGKQHKSAIIQVALDITYQQNVIGQYTRLLILTLAIVMLAAFLVGYFIAGRAMRGLYRLTEVTKKITAASLHKRMNPQSWPTELNSLGVALDAMLSRIETAFLRLTQFSADLAHELRTPINNLMGEAEIVLSKPHSVAQYREVLESHLEELQRIAQIIENILFLARTENPKLNLKTEYLDIANEIALICDYYQAMADEKNIRVLHQGHAVLEVNSIMFRRAISNLLSNALKYTPNGGTVAINVRELNDAVEITVTDNGIGIAAEHIAKLFNRFYRVDSARARAAGGIGLGLPIVKSIIELHHGTISVASELEKGTAVTVVIPKGDARITVR